MTESEQATPAFLVIGHAARDLVPGGWRWGGTVTYAALLARAWDVPTAVLTSLAAEDVPGYQALLGEDVLLHALPSPVTTTMENIYTDAGRRQLLHAKAARIEPGHVPAAWREAPIVLAGPIIGETSTRFGASFSPGTLAGMTIQGRLRSHQRGRVYTRRWTRAAHEFPPYTVIFFSDEDVGGSERLGRHYASQTRFAVMTQGDGGATLFEHGRISRHAAFPANPRDPTGAGDIFAAAFLLHYAAKRDAAAACQHANAAAACSIERVGADEMPTPAQVAARMRSARG